ncbi:hypothetical protein LTR91_003973 [Friedmanniomyces endolithicus]|uniref:RNA-dependent RNA polymerase n=1 Tax=Friedmanniomyces endolithicus TaxID=329885 RepID=A0AAN6KXE7_9PEZI|nr:hypothetical protein LTR91_003973 [Friedmanniomyces endolithicus]
MASSQTFNDLLRSPVDSRAATPKISPKRAPTATPPRGTPTPGPKRKTSAAASPTPKRTYGATPSPLRLPQRPPPPRIRAPSFAGWPGVKVKVLGMPESWWTWDVYEHLRPYGNLSRIEIFERRFRDSQEGYVIFRPPPQATKWLVTGLDIHKGDAHRHLEFRYEQLMDRSQNNAGSPESLTVPVARMDVGVLREESEMLSFFSSKPSTHAPLELVVNGQRKRLELRFSIPASQLQSNAGDGTRSFRVSTDFSNIRSVRRSSTDDAGTVLLIDLETPPILDRKTTNVRKTHDPRVMAWNEHQAWFRQTGIDLNPSSADAPTQLRKDGPILDVGRWLTYRLVFIAAEASSTAFEILGRLFTESNVHKSSGDGVTAAKMITGDVDDLWNWAESPLGSLSSFHSMNAVQLEFGVRYQLEVCLSQNILHECNIDTEFMERLASLDPAKAVKLLEKAADGKKRYYNAMDIFRLLGQVSVAQKKPPRYCALIRGAVITPTTIHYASPVLETSNRVFRDYRYHEDRFLRVKFTDERYRGKIMNGEDGTQDEVFARVKAVLQDGILVGDRRYEFLAFGNSQFREHGAYFFAPTGGIDAAYIRARMGTFKQLRDLDRNVAKYASRLGQAFTTTRGMSLRVDIQNIPDIKRNGDCFTDGVGKISPFLAQTIAYELGLPNSSTDYPSVFQFRIAGCKGVLAVDPALKGQVVFMRPSQMKFPADHYGLEVCRHSQFTSANLNVQIILVLNARGVPTGTFIRKMEEALSDIEQAMTSEEKAEQQLCRKTDFNGMTLVLVDMIKDGFMSVQEPFFISCLRLWRSWMNKYLKEKARIPVDQGAFVFGCIDETATLKGHYENEIETDPVLTDKTVLPEIFLQIKDPLTGQYRVVEEICTLARNPSLHPGDCRVVRAVDVPALHHLKDCVVLPQTGDRGLASMCSGGDLDGDDYLVMWDKELLPKEWYYPPMNYEAPPPLRSDGPVTVDDITTFFVKHMQNDNVGRIAMAHRFWADSNDCPAGVKDDRCLELARLHSMAVDYAKSGIPATFPKNLRIKRWPHWAEKDGKPSYHSRKVLGRLYDEVQRVPFLPAWDQPFDTRILSAYDLDDALLDDAREIKTLYDEAVRRIMAQHSIQSEFEIWTTFILGHSQEDNDYKLAERLGETVTTLKQRHQELCYEKAGTTPQEREWEKMGPFVAAMYTVTAREVEAASATNKEMRLVAGQHVPARQAAFGNMPFMSFPWIFPRELGHIARGRVPGSGRGGYQGSTVPGPVDGESEVAAAAKGFGELGSVGAAAGAMPALSSEAAAQVPTSANSAGVGTKSVVKESEILDNNPKSESATTLPDVVVRPSPSRDDTETHADSQSAAAIKTEEGEAENNTDEGSEAEEEPSEIVLLDIGAAPSALDALSKLVGFS